MGWKTSKVSNDLNRKSSINWGNVKEKYAQRYEATRMYAEDLIKKTPLFNNMNVQNNGYGTTGFQACGNGNNFTLLT